MSNENVVLVTGGTGSQGGATVTHLLAAKKVRVRVLTRNLESPKAKSLAARGVEVVKGDFDDEASLRTALAGVSAAFSVQQWTEKGGTAAEELHGKRFADAVKASGSPHLVYSSAEGVERKSGLGHYESKWAIEQHIRDLKLPATILRPVGFMDAFGAPAMQRGMFLGMFRANLGLSHRVQFVATYDIGWFAARALEDPERYAGRVIPLAGDELSVGEIIKTFKTVTGHKPWVAPIPAFLAKKMMPKEFLDMFTWIREKGFKADIAQVRQEYPQLLTFAGWVKKYTDEH
ncbi:Uncharacterized conserved protein YbjT, contains NAD(P)-binding and DUF2867 domains [Burkholderia sp. D7]|nr:Uncharacterized conserved protein YbjT, contains NAD(P)-binding and DUF2867 domains [Burkholderia sp. D7]